MATTVVPAIGLASLGWWIAVQDRALEGQRARLQRDQAVELAATALQRTLAELENRLTTGPASSAVKADADSAILVFESQQLVEHTGLSLPYYPGLPQPPVVDDRFARADVLEFRDTDSAGAIRILEPLGTSRDHALAAHALVRIARNQQKLGHPDRTLAALDQLMALHQTRVDGWPAGLRARQGRALLFAAAGRIDDLHREAAAVFQDLASGRWMLSRPQYTFAMSQVRSWLGDGHTSKNADPERLALAQAADDLWQQGQRAEPTPSILHPRQTRWSGDRSVLVLTRSSGHRTAVLLAGPRLLERVWRRPLLGGATVGLDIGLSDADGRPVLGSPVAPFANQSVRTASTTQLPWTVHAIGAGGPAGGLGLSGPGKLMLSAVAIMTIVVIAGGYVINRAIAREIAVARLQSDFVTAVSHEFRTPLTTLRHLSELLVQRRVSSETRREQFYETLLRESGRLHRLVEGLLNFARLEAGELEYRLETIDLRAFLDATISEVRLEVASNGYHVEFGGVASPISVRADRDLLARVFWNLIDNAMKYSPSVRTVRVELSASETSAAIRVCDQGIGIPLEEQADVFRKFARGAAARHSAIRGTGIGLAMAREIVRAHGGAISLESEVGRGSTFTVVLPREA